MLSFATKDALRYYAKRLAPFFILCIGLEFLGSAIIAIQEFQNLNFGTDAILGAFIWILTTALTTLGSLWVVIIYLLALPRKLHATLFDKIITLALFFIYAFLNIFEEISEWLFWDEFTSRFNFVAVDYLIYTTEVVGNIMQSYPVIPIISVIVLVCAIATFLARKKILQSFSATAPKFSARFAASTAFILATFVLATPNYMALSDKIQNRYISELSREGLYSFVQAFLRNELAYADFYITLPNEQVRDVVKNIGLDSEISPASAPQAEHNVIIVLMESMGSEFFTEFSTRDNKTLTHNLENIAAQGIYFSHTYATGTRSVRGLEALSVGLPPLPGQAIVRRPDNDNLYTIGSVFRDMGYETKWIYGGYGYFDNMNGYFGANNFAVVDRRDFDKDEITFTNAWGVCDEDLFNKIIKEADKSHAAGKKFMNIILTTSNHRPFTYPEGKIDLPPKVSGRNGAVKYADFAVGEFIKNVQNKAWFDNTIFVFVADHGAGSAGKQELNFDNHHIPLIIYAPKIIAPKRIDTPISQIDAIPTLLSLMGLDSQARRFIGQNALSENYVSRVFLGNYQKIAYIKGDEALIMSPIRVARFYKNGKFVSEQRADERGKLPNDMGADSEMWMLNLVTQGASVYQYADSWKEFMKE